VLHSGRLLPFPEISDLGFEEENALAYFVRAMARKKVIQL
jgi:hypothetical protein